MQEEKKPFDPRAHLIKVSGNDYLPVAARIMWFRADHPDGRIDTEHLASNDKWAHYRATASYPHVVDGSVEWALGSGHGQGFVNTTAQGHKFHERGETVAIGRALATLGYGTSFCDDFNEGEDIADAPVTRSQSGNATPSEMNRTQSRRPPSGNAEQMPATDRQVKFLFAIGREVGLSDDQLNELSLQRYKQDVDKLTRSNASNLIEILQQRRDAQNGA